MIELLLAEQVNSRIFSSHPPAMKNFGAQRQLITIQPSGKSSA